MPHIVGIRRSFTVSSNVWTHVSWRAFCSCGYESGTSMFMERAQRIAMTHFRRVE